MYCSPNFLAIVFKKQDISQQVLTKMPDLSSEFSKNFQGVITPDPHSRRGRPPPVSNTQPGLCLGAGHKRPGVGTQTLVSLNFSAVVAPLKTSVRPLGFRPTRISLSNHIPKMLCIFLTAGAYTPYATCMATPLIRHKK